MCQSSKLQKFYYASSSWLGDKRTKESNKYTNFPFFTCKNHNKGIVAISILVANMSDHS